MAELRNSKRSLDRATYTQVSRSDDQQTVRRAKGRAWEKWSYYAALAPTVEQLDTVIGRLVDTDLGDDDRAALQMLRTTTVEGAGAGKGPVFASMAGFSRISPDLLLRVGSELASQVDEKRLAAVKNLNATFEQSLDVEPVGYLHLERLNFVPAGIERGELEYSVPLSPSEEVNIAHKEWSHTSEEYQRIVTDYLEEYSEQGVSEKTDLAQSTSSQSQHSMGFSLSASATGGYGPVSVTTSASFNVAESSSESQQASRTHSSELTSKASKRSKKEHKTSYKVASAAGTEDQAVRKIKNPFDNKAVRVDYYQLVRKWKVELYRYGLRLTYDITIPEPGSDILSKILEIKAHEEMLGKPFEFDVDLAEVTRDDWADLAAKYGASVEPPPEETIQVGDTFTRKWGDEDEAEHAEFTKIELIVPDQYTVTSYGWTTNYQSWDDEIFETPANLDSWIGRSGRMSFAVKTKHVSAFKIEITLHCTLKEHLFKAWQLGAWNAIRRGAIQRYDESRVLLKDRIARLKEELGSQDPLSLRQLEREEVMKGVLRWLFGSDFEFRHDFQDLYDDESQGVNWWVLTGIRAQMAMVKFLHHAIEWENMLYFLYPYFWSHTGYWEVKKYLDHPDLLHRMFLRAGAARVVLTIRPGFEKEFVSVLDGEGDGGDDTSPYLTIAEEMQAFARTNYPGIRAANPVEGARPLLSPRQRKAWREMEGIIALIEKYKQDNGVYPTTAQGLAVLDGDVPDADPWGKPYKYTSPGVSNDYELVSHGADKAEGGEGENADITSWAEASLIGQWYEYTPTSAVDIAFNETLPSA